MWQKILVIIIVILSVIYSIRKIYIFFKERKKKGCCESEACASCPFYSKEGCDTNNCEEKESKQ